jgi:hypothetical protein
MYKAKVKALKSFIDNKTKMRKRGDVWEIDDKEKANRFVSYRLIKILKAEESRNFKVNKGYGTKMVKTYEDKMVSPDKDKQDEKGEQVKHIGAGWFELPDGRRVRGKENAIEKLQEG